MFPNRVLKKKEKVDITQNWNIFSKDFEPKTKKLIKGVLLRREGGRRIISFPKWVINNEYAVF